MGGGHKVDCVTGKSLGCTCGRAAKMREYNRQSHRRHRQERLEYKRQQPHNPTPPYRDRPEAYKAAERERMKDPARKARLKKATQRDQERATRRGRWDLDELIYLLEEPSNKIAAFTLGRTIAAVHKRRRDLRRNGLPTPQQTGA